MSEQNHHVHGHTPERTAEDVKLSWGERRRNKIYAEIERNRRGEYTVPTWVLAVLLGLAVAAIAAIIICG
ncbi:hypothetical protein QEZ54_26510 [Catellatospora sp. KI3]|uniref:hypothetical protein n=1 Tax=Catellatospora sp. KI3 TaxID=3041620 RepID=UPI002482F094|nr:hypothetical protein [Catellatospora sp. KI3]MDI1464527.1 hypothetical protein [Catellatospora sp. KI3]